MHVAALNDGCQRRLAVVELRLERLVVNDGHVKVGGLVRGDGSLGDRDGDAALGTRDSGSGLGDAGPVHLREVDAFRQTQTHFGRLVNAAGFRCG